jgi:hypothetical protein
VTTAGDVPALRELEVAAGRLFAGIGMDQVPSTRTGRGGGWAGR